MESALATLITKLVEYGPGFVVAGLFVALFMIERKKNEKLSEKLYDLGLASLKSDLEHTKAYESMEKTLDVLAKALSKGESS